MDKVKELLCLVIDLDHIILNFWSYVVQLSWCCGSQSSNVSSLAGQSISAWLALTAWSIYEKPNQMGILGIGKGGRDERASWRGGAKARTSEQSKPGRVWWKALTRIVFPDRLINISLFVIAEKRSKYFSTRREFQQKRDLLQRKLTWMFHRHRVSKVTIIGAINGVFPSVTGEIPYYKEAEDVHSDYKDGLLEMYSWMYSRSGLPGTGGESMYVHIYQVALMDFSGNHKDQGEPLAVFPAL